MKKYWQDLEELNKKNIEIPEEEFSSTTDNTSLVNIIEDKSYSSRRNFLKLFGFSIAGVSVLSSCEKPIQKAIPYLIKPETISPGKADYYASTYYDGEQYGSILVKVRDGRPIKIEGNDLSPLSKGSTSAVVQASVLELYDNNRIQKPYINQEASNWEELDNKILKELNELKASNGRKVLLTSSIISPSTLSVIDKFKTKISGLEHIMYDPVSANGILNANETMFGKRIIPYYNFDKAKLIVSFNADFLGNWIMPVEFAKGYIAGRRLSEGQKSMNRHIHYESGMSLTGSNADKRITIKPSEEKLAIATLYNTLLKLTGKTNSSPLPTLDSDVSTTARELVKQKGKSLVVSGSNDTEVQLLVNAINYLLENYDKTINLNKAILTKQGNDKNLFSIVKEMNAGSVDALFIYNANPAYDLPEAEAFKSGINKVQLTVNFSNTWNETTLLSKYLCPDSHFLESWNDANPITGQYSLAQPTINRIFDTRQYQESLLTWSEENITYLEFIKNYWKKNLYKSSGEYVNFTDFWNRSLQNGVLEIPQKNGVSLKTAKLNEISSILQNLKPTVKGTVEVHLYESNTIGTGKHSNNPWLQETPDAISKVCWDNYAAISPKFAEEYLLKTGDVISINNKLEIAVLVQPGQKYGTLSIALGYGREKTGIAGKDVGINAYPLIQWNNNFRSYFATVEIKKTEKTYILAMTQTHNSMEGRNIIREASLEEYIQNPSAGNEAHEKIQHHLESLYEKHKYEGHHWGMTVDLNSCIGCNACVVGCTAENNVPVVGKTEVHRVHEMHWIRIDRYYSGDPENPEVSRQPVMCQHCDNAPCENVCPVAATTHSSEGINQMAYNRCIGTRYCNNNCPYKVRRFNWFDYTKADALPANTVDPAGMTLDLPRMVLNPDVTVRAKGVMEKCSFCIQRVQERKLQAKLEGRPIADGEIKTACQQACPTKAITFGDMSDKNSLVTKLMKDKRNYHLLEELHTLPSVGYLTKIRNT